MSFVIDPRICLVTGREIGATGHDCCGNDQEFREQSTGGLGSLFSEKRKDNALRARMAERSAVANQSSLIDFTPPGLRRGPQAGEYVPPSRSLEFLKARPSVSSPPQSAVLQIESAPGRRTTLVGMLRRMFGPQAG